MREERGQLKGDQVVSEPYTLWGSVSGNITVVTIMILMALSLDSWMPRRFW